LVELILWKFSVLLFEKDWDIKLPSQKTTTFWVIFSVNASEEKWYGCHSKILIERSSTK
jgi:hypothetical protein